MSSRNKWITIALDVLITLYIINEFFRHFIFNFPIWLFVNIPLFLIMFVGGVFLLILLGIGFFKRKEKGKNFIPLIMSLLLFFLLLANPLSPLFQKSEFNYNLDERVEVANLISDGKIQSSNTGGNLFHIPANYKSSTLSDANEVMKVNEKLVFFTNRGILDNFSGYVFSPNGVEPNDEDLAANIVKMKKMKKNWYYVSCT
ncbi:hypothetical protein NCCP2716_30140 [Sporosarcina sp. NCCP-2716]|uniref:hypothetical protein n=1 Tax=Sporosarcina sp. NCCP-2716 TaxID=2943679 RepID=UPI00203D217E|nr:hypothetical protein [Sporosarcina sp. NCCP-2716]GKV70516.1 hypothetical protein NCCP2716_30140 [Sporosarcina sp. NCCP-2716]